MIVWSGWRWRFAGLDEERRKRDTKAQRYAELVRSLSETPAVDESAFQEQRQRFSDLIEAAKASETKFQNQEKEHEFDFRQGRQEHEELSTEIASLKARKNNIDEKQVAMRATLCAALNLPEAEMPYAGELLQVREDEKDWEGAAERLLRNFALSLLVPDEHYARVAEWVDKTNLKGRLVYFRIRPVSRSESGQLHRDSLVRKLAIKPDSPFYDWLEREVANRFDVACCATPEQFRRETRAITRAGQIKMPGERHEKDDTASAR